MKGLFPTLVALSLLVGCERKPSAAKPSCEEIASRFEAALSQAKRCEPGKDACDRLVAGDLGCGCPTLANSKRASLPEVNQIVQEHVKAGCPVDECKCRSPQSATCKPLPAGGGRCEDVP